MVSSEFLRGAQLLLLSGRSIRECVRSFILLIEAVKGVVVLGNKSEESHVHDLTGQRTDMHPKPVSLNVFITDRISNFISPYQIHALPRS